MVRKKINLRFVIRSYFFWVVLPMATLFLFAYALDFLVPEDPESIADVNGAKNIIQKNHHQNVLK